ncbi:MAG: response regulator [Elusimicrobiota bacterium]|jgi:CheY-like chemotaxis protein
MAKKTLILIVEDDAVISENLKALMEARGFTAVCAADGAAGLVLARKNKPALVLLDIMLPKMDGFDVCRMLKTSPGTKDIRIIMITGLERMGDVEKAFASGADDYIIKPFDPVRMFKKIEKFVTPD